MAGRIPQSFIDDVVERNDIVELIEQRVKLKRTGKNLVGLCPFHQEKTPSFSVSPDKQFYHCFGCGASGNALKFLMEHDRLEFLDALEQLASNAGMQLPQDNQSNQPDDGRRELYNCLEKANQYYQQQLRQHPQRGPVIDYLKGRGLNGQTAKSFGLGFAPKGWENLIKALKSQGVSEQLMVDAGLVVEKDQGGQYDRFRQRVIFPIRNRRGKVIAFGGRVLDEQKPKYLNSPETAVFHKQQELYGLYEAKQKIKKFQRVIIVEGYMDVIALQQQGIDYAVATLGTATSESHLNQLFQLVSEVVLCFDGDNAGRQAAQRALEIALPLLQDGRDLRLLFLPDGEDPDTLVRKEGQTAFESRIKSADSVLEYLLNQLSSQVNMQSLAGRAQFKSLAQPYINKLPSGTLKQLMRQRVQEIIGVARPQGGKSGFRAERTVNPSRIAMNLTTEDWALRLLLLRPQLVLLTPGESQSISQIGAEKHSLLANLLKKVLDNPEQSGIELIIDWPEASQQRQLQQLLEQLPQSLALDTLETEWRSTIKAIMLDSQEQRLATEVGQNRTSADFRSLSAEEKQRMKSMIEALGRKTLLDPDTQK